MKFRSFSIISVTFSQVVVIDIENLCFDLHYSFHKSSKRKDKLRGYFQFCTQEYQAILIQISMRLLSLELRSVTTSHKLASLKVYVISENFSDKPFKDLMIFLLIHYLNQYHCSSQIDTEIFVQFDKTLQRDNERDKPKYTF